MIQRTERESQNTEVSPGFVESLPRQKPTIVSQETERPARPPVRQQPPVRRRSHALERQCVELLYRRIGRPAVQLVLWDGTILGDCCATTKRVVFHHPRGLRRLLTNPILGFCESYTAADIDVEGDLIAVLTELNRGLSRAGGTTWNPRLPPWLWGQHSLFESRRNVQNHYDLGNPFYQLWLDPQLVYTCAYYTSSEAKLEEAQTAKLDYVCRKLRLSPGETVVDAGCGWGALDLHLARHYGVTVRAFNLSPEQLDYARSRARAEGLQHRIEFIDDDYRNITGTCDAFVSVGMLEHVGPENYRGLGQLIGRILSPTGRGLIHSIGRNVARPLDPWTVKHIFPGAYVPSLMEMMTIFEHSDFSVLDVENLRLHYAKTCAEWFERFEEQSAKVAQMFDAEFVRMWRLYLAASSASFESGDLQLFQVVFARANHNQLPLTRTDWYR